jgi:hypothetical protein
LSIIETSKKNKKQTEKFKIIKDHNKEKLQISDNFVFGIKDKKKQPNNGSKMRHNSI